MKRGPLLALGFLLSWPMLTVFLLTYLVLLVALVAVALGPWWVGVVPLLAAVAAFIATGLKRGQTEIAPWRDMLVSGVALMAAVASLQAGGGSLPPLMVEVIRRDGRVVVLVLSAFAFLSARWMPALYRALLLVNAGRCSFVLLRPFSSVVSRRTRLVVAPAFGAYGRVRLVADAGFDEPAPAAVLGVDTDVVMDFHHQMIAGQGNWRPSVRLLIEQADFAVVDVSAYSENVVWEVEQCREVMGPSRILFIASDGRAAASWSEIAGRSAGRARPGTLRRPLSYSNSWSFRWRVLACLFRRSREAEG